MSDASASTTAPATGTGTSTLVIEAPEANAGKGTTATTTTEQTTEGKTFTQAELDKIVVDRLRQQKAQFGDVEDLKVKAARLDAIEEANKTENQKAIDKAVKEAKEQILSSTALERVADKIEVRASGVLADPDLAPAILGDLSRFVGKDGSIDTNAIDAAVKEIAEKRPHLAAAARNVGDGDGGQRGGAATSGKGDMDSLIRGLARSR